MLSITNRPCITFGRAALAAVFVTVTAVGCDPEAVDDESVAVEDDEAPVDLEPLADVAVDAPVEQEFLAPNKPPRSEFDDLAAEDGAPVEAQLMWYTTWYQGNGAIGLGGVNDRFCFLADVGGDFAGAGERVHVYQSGGSWWLGGYSGMTGLRASALCIPKTYYGQTLSYSGEYTWSQGNNATLLGSETGRICFLSRVEGKFSGAGERVEVYRSGGSWWLGGSSQQGGVAAGARCVNTGYIAGPYHWSQGSAPTSMASANDWACGLTRMTGEFEGSGERVTAYYASDWWYLGGSSAQSGVAASAYCM